jgi:hypothetical protein
MLSCHSKSGCASVQHYGPKWRPRHYQLTLSTIDRDSSRARAVPFRAWLLALIVLGALFHQFIGCSNQVSAVKLHGSTRSDK